MRGRQRSSNGGQHRNKPAASEAGPVDGTGFVNRTPSYVFYWIKRLSIAAAQGACHCPPVEDVKLLFSKLRRLLYSRGRNIDETEDLIQEAFLRLREYDRKRTVLHTEAFLVRTVLNLLTDHHRRRKAVVEVSDSAALLSLIDPKPTPDVILESQKRLQHFKAGLRALSPRQREVFVLNRIEGCSFAQVAEQLGITVSMAEKHAARALLFLGDWMDPDKGPLDQGRRKS